jgi:hypothetical protein
VSSSPDVLRLPQALAAWGSDAFSEVLRRELIAAGEHALPLRRCMAYGNHIAATPIHLLMRSVEADADRIHAQLDILFQSVVAGCSCTDDPTPWSELDECCRVQVDIDRTTALAVIRLLD